MKIGKIKVINIIIMIASLAMIFYGITKHTAFNYVVGSLLFFICLADIKLRERDGSLNDPFIFGSREVAVATISLIVGYIIKLLF